MYYYKMGIFYQQPYYNQSYSKGKPIRGVQGPPGIGFNLTSDGNYDMTNKKLTNMAKRTAFSDAVTKINWIQLWVINIVLTRILI